MKTKLYERKAECNIVNQHGIWRLLVYVHKVTRKEHIALISLKTDLEQPVLVRIHSSCVTGDLFFDKSCDCRPQLDEAMKQMVNGGILFYLFQEGRGIGLVNKVRAYALKERGYDTVEANLALGLPADLRTYGMVGEMLDDLGIREVKMMTNNPDKIEAVEKMGIKVKRISLQVEATKYTKKYLYTKKNSMKHKLK